MTSGSGQAAAAARAAKKNQNQPPRVSKIGTLLTLLSIYSALKKGNFVMGNYSKFIASIAGSLVAAGILWLANKGLATCTTVGDAETCAILGISTGQINAAVVAIISAGFVWAFPPNTKA